MKPAQNRRKFLKTSSLFVAAALLPGLSACSSFEPRPFTVGAVVTAPMGCQQLLQRDPQGDC